MIVKIEIECKSFEEMQDSLDAIYEEIDNCIIEKLIEKNFPITLETSDNSYFVEIKESK